MDSPSNVLIVEDNAADFLLIQRHLHKNGMDAHCCHVTRSEDFLACLEDIRWDVVLSDYNVPGMRFEESFLQMRSIFPDIPFILVTGTIGEEKAVELLKLGVTDFVLKGNLARLVPAIQRALHEVSELQAKRIAAQALHEKEQLLQEMSTLAHIGAWEYVPATKNCSWTDEVAKIFEVEPSFEINIESIFKFFHGKWRQIIQTGIDDAVASGKSFDLELEIVAAKGGKKWVRVVGIPIFDSGKVVKLRGSIQDITDRKLNEILLFEQKERAEITLHSIGDGVITTDARGCIDYLNPIAQGLTGWQTEDAIGKPLMEVLNLVDENKKLPLPNPIQLVLSEGKVGRLPMDCLLIGRHGISSAIEDSAAPIRDRDGTIIGAVLVFRDVTATREITALVAYQAMHDPLTGLPNRMLAWDRLEQAIGGAQREGSCVGILFLNLDRFKNINDSLGHNAGDRVLEQIASRLQSVTRAADTVCRQGGDEFLMIIPDAGHKMHVADLAKKILTTVSTPYFVDELEVNLTFSVGISIYPHDGSDPSTLIKNANAAMFHAKGLGRDTYQFYDADMNRNASERHSLEVQLRHAVMQRQFVPYFQPKVDIANKKLIGAEALIRWNHPQLGIQSPGKFIGIAEESGLIVPIGQWLKEEVCKQSQQWRQRGISCVPISVNLSAIQFRNKSLVESMRLILEETQVPPELLELELTESIIMHGTDTVIGILHSLKDLGLKLSIDDFGTGYSSLSYLKRFPIDTLKIDQTFVRDISHDENDAAIVKAIISMAHSLKMKVIAEGVETEEQLAFLEANDCDEIQGYYFSHPLPSAAFEEMLKRPRSVH